MSATLFEPRMKVLYRETLRDQLQNQLDLPNVMQVPRLSKISVNAGVGDALVNRAFLDSAVEDLTKVTGQKPAITRAKKSIAGFRVREDMPMGAKVTLRGARMYEFMDRLTTVAMPRIRDFRGVSSKSFDGRGNYAFGIKEHIVFPEIDFDKIDEDWGLDVVITTTAETDAEAKSLLGHFNMPFSN